MNKIRHLLFFLAFSATLQGQDLVFSQFYAAPVYLNPGFTGNTLAPRIALNYRNQWPQLKAYTSYSFSYDQFVPVLNSGFGANVVSDNQGDGIYKQIQATILYSYKARLNRDWTMKLGVGAGILQSVLDWDKLIFYDQLDDVTGPLGPGGSPNPTNENRPADLNKIVPDFSAGLLAYSQSFYAGASIKHINTPDESFTGTGQNLSNGRPFLFSVHTGGEVPLQSRRWNKNPLVFSPQLVYIQQNRSRQLNAGGFLSWNLVFAGVMYRHSFSNPDAVILNAGFSKDIFRFGYSFDYTVSGLGNLGGAHEFSLILNFENSEKFKKKQWAGRYNDCLNLFR